MGEQDDSQAPQIGAVGDWLRAAREGAGETRAQAAAALHLDVEKIAALEEEQFEVLGANVFVKGHLRTYAAHLKLDVNEASERFSASENLGDADPKLVVAFAAHPAGDRRNLWLAITAIVVLILVGIALWRLADSGEVDASTQLRPSSNVLLARDNASDTQARQTAASEDPTAEAGSFDSLLSNARQDERSNTSASTAISVAPSTSADAESQAATSGELRLKFSSECWYEVKDAGGRRLAYGTARAGTQRDISGAQPFAITLGVADAVEVYFGGRQVSVPTSNIRGRAVRFTLPIQE